MVKTVTCGIENTTYPLPRDGASVGLITNSSAATADGKASVSLLANRYTIKALFAPEHGFFAAGEAGGAVADCSYSGIPVYSLYGERTSPEPEMLRGLDALMFDMQDVGARFYTYLYTMTRSMKSAAAAGIPFYVFDRPNPVGRRVEGEMLDEQYASFVGEYAVPTRYGLTIGEFARYINEKKNLGADLRVVPCVGYNGDMYFDETGLPFVPPSPNIPDPETALVYTATCIFESVRNISEGRGTSHPFSLVGAPFIDGKAVAREMNSYGMDGVRFEEAYFTPESSKHAGVRCGGVRIRVTDKRAFSPFECCVRLFCLLRKAYSPDISESANIRLFGTPRLLSCDDPDTLIADCRALSLEFRRESNFAKLYRN